MLSMEKIGAADAGKGGRGMTEADPAERERKEFT